tara:strand:- start:164 stop:913 length:750 start_codon:yes stop_codon:yes gene_type:complete
MPNLLIADPNDNDGVLGKSVNVTDNSDQWVNTRGSTSGLYEYITNTSNSSAISARNYTWGTGAANRQMWINRLYLIFDTSGISVTPTDATLKLYGYSAWNDDVIAVKHDAPSPLDKADWDKIYGCTSQIAATDGAGYGTFASCATNYSAELTSGTTSGYNDIVLNSAALDDMVSEDTFKIAVIQYDNDYLDITPYPANSKRCGTYLTEDTDGGRDPYIDYTEGFVEPIVFNEIKVKNSIINIKNGSLKL